MSNNLEVGLLNPLAHIEHTKKLNTANVDAIVASACVQMPSLGSIQPIEDRAGMPVLSSSVATTYMSANGAPYNMGKAVMEALATTLSREERPHRVHVNVVAPGLVETDMGIRLTRAMTGNRDLRDLRSLDAVSPFGRVCQPDDIAQAVLWLVGPGSGYVTGQRIEVDGGGR